MSVVDAILKSLESQICVLPMLDHAARNDRHTMAPFVVIVERAAEILKRS